MDQFRQIGEVLGGMRALMVLQNRNHINQRQCCLIFDVFSLAFETITEMIKQNLEIESMKWKPLEKPLVELLKIFKESELYVRNCLEIKNWWGKALMLHQNKDCVEFHIHNLLSFFPVVIEALEAVIERSASDEECAEKRRFVLTRKYDFAWNDQKLFWWKFGRQYLVTREICNRLDSAWKEDKWHLLESLREKSSSLNKKNNQRLGDFIMKKLSGWEGKEKVKLLPSSILLGAKDYSVKRRLGSGGSHCKEIHWLGENFAMRTFFGEIKEPLDDEISLALSLSHPNILQYLCGFHDEQKKEGFLVMELMQKNLATYIKENSGQRKKEPFTIPVAVDIMLQIARGMEHLHSKKIYHGELNPENVLLKPRSSSPDNGYFHAKLKGFCLTSIKSTYKSTPSQNEIDPVIWYAPEVLAEQEQHKQHTHKRCSKYTEKADVYSFAMLCFELLTGKVPFEDDHLQGDKMVRNIKAGGRPLFPHTFPKYLVNLTKKCWQTNPFLRPSFSSVCRILRYIKKVLIVNPAQFQPNRSAPVVDYCDFEAGYSSKFPEDGSFDLAPVSQIPFQMFSYRLFERVRTDENGSRAKNLDPSDESFLLDDRFDLDDLFPGNSDRRSVCSEIIERKGSFVTFADQRSVSSEAPQRKNFLSDQASNFLVSPIRKFSSSAFGGTPERISWKKMQNFPKAAADSKSVCYEIPEEKSEADSSTSDLSYSLTKEEMNAKAPSKKTNEEGQSPMISQNHEKKKVTLPMAVEQGPTVSHNQEKNKLASPTTVVEQNPSPRNSEASQHGRERTQSTEASNKKCDSSKTLEKKAAPTTKVRPRMKPVFTKKIKDYKTSTGFPEHQSPSASPARSFRGNDSPSASPARTFRGTDSPGASPARSFGGFSSPQASPLNPCNRCHTTNRNKENPAPSGLNPSRSTRG